MPSNLGNTSAYQIGSRTRFSKHQEAASNPTAFLLVKQIYADAIEFTGVPVGSRGLLLFVGLIGAAFSLWISYDILFQWLEYDLLDDLDVVGIIVAFILGMAGIYLLAVCIRLELFRPLDEPTIFDRKNRKIYRSYRQVSLQWRDLFRQWPCRTDTYEWDYVYAEHHASLNANSATVSRNHSLVFVVVKSSDDPITIADFSIGGVQMGAVSVPAVWEHIRRFMDANGPHVPDGEHLMQLRTPPSLWQILSDMGPYGRGLRTWWRTQKVMTIFAYAFGPILLPGCIVLSVCAWLSYRTAMHLDWPRDILDEVGPPIS